MLEPPLPHLVGLCPFKLSPRTAAKEGSWCLLQGWGEVSRFSWWEKLLERLVRVDLISWKSRSIKFDFKMKLGLILMRQEGSWKRGFLLLISEVLKEEKVKTKLQQGLNSQETLNIWLALKPCYKWSLSIRHCFWSLQFDLGIYSLDYILETFGS